MICRLVVATGDAPAPLRTNQSSGIQSVQVKWGDGAKPLIKNDKASHVYRRRRTYTVTVIVKDRASNKTVVTRKLKITRPGAAGNKSKSKPKKKQTTRLRPGFVSAESLAAGSAGR